MTTEKWVIAHGLQAQNSDTLNMQETFLGWSIQLHIGLPRQKIYVIN